MIITRAAWGAKQASLPRSPMQLPAVGVFIHHSVTLVSDDVYKDMRAIEAVGLQRFGQFPYSYCIHPKNGEVLEGCGLMRGAHTERKNSSTFGICWIGNYEERVPKIQQLDSTRQLISELAHKNYLSSNYFVNGHRDTGFATACPGRKLYAMLNQIKVPWRGTMADNPDLHNIEGPLSLHPVIDSNGTCWGYYIFSQKTGELHAYGDPNKVPYHGRSEDVTP